MKTLLPSITTTRGSSWQSQLAEVCELGLTQVAVFPTCMDYKQRKDFYEQLESIAGLRIPFVHARNDMGAVEYRYFVVRFGTEYFNLHPRRHFTDDYIKEVGDCVTVTPTHFRYVDGEEPGVIIGWINYPRFPREPEEIKERAFNLAKHLMMMLNQERMSITTPDETYMLERDEI